MNTPTWQELLAREPELTPNFTPLRTFVVDPARGRCDATIYTPDREEAHAALCRDAALQWLPKQPGGPIEIVYVNDSLMPPGTQEIWWVRTRDLRLRCCATYDEAVRLVVRKVLDARGAGKGRT